MNTITCDHHESNHDRTVESGTVFCRLCDLNDRRRDAEGSEKELHAQLADRTASLDACERSRGELERELKARESEVSRMRDVIRETEHERELLERYKRDLDEIGRAMGCDHKDDGYLRCVTDELAKVDRLESRLADAERVIESHAQHKSGCNGFPATTQEQVDRNCDCGLQAYLSSRRGKAVGT